MKICLGIATRNRPQMLRQLLESMARLTIPADCSVTYVIVENNATLTLGEQVERLGRDLALGAVRLENEPQLGIPYARNRILDIALNEQADYLTYVDDDETVDPQWLVELTKVCLYGSYDLAGGPVRITQIDAGLSLQARWVHAEMVRRFGTIEAKADRLAKAGVKSRTAVVTNNWMGRLDFFRKTGLRFDETIGLGGGSDAKLFHDAIKLGAVTGWASQALVYERQPPERLTFHFHFLRARNQAIAVQKRGYRSSKPPKAISVWSVLVRRLALTPVRLLASLLTGGKGMLKTVTLLGDAFGNLAAFYGARDTHYQKPTGA